MATIYDGFKTVFLAGIGAVALTGEAAKKAVDQMISKGELTVEQGKSINDELRQKASAAGDTVRDSALEARLRMMTPEQRESFVAKAAELVEKLKAESVEATVIDVETEEVEESEEPQAADSPIDAVVDVMEDVANTAAAVVEDVVDAVKDAIDGVADQDKAE